ncbi:MFS transporter [Nocardioides zeae]|uniref:MFS transporter n=1 Tax=Nocardioides imazamoxiresistens TaxID=3231893 RepID=A0ABU3PR38_9ACTN|nr:MFS transporter [Nocardioides zeae]MDT9591706.1 MFS transporter [Nocardioides zeae]
MSEAPIPAPAPRTGRPEPDRPRPSALPVGVIVALVAVVGLNLRASMGSLPPLLDEIDRDLGLSSTAAGLLTSVAIAFMGLCAPAGQRLGARIGPELATGVLMLVLAGAGLVRALPLPAPLLFVSAAVAGAAMGGCSALMPSLIAHHVPAIRGMTTGIYSTGLALGVAVAAGTAVPLEGLLGDWRPALAFWGAVSAVTAALWLLLVPALRGPRRRETDPTVPAVVVDHRMPWRSRTAWLVVGFTTTQMIIGFSGLAWITPLYVSLGLPAQEAANMFVLFQVVQVATMLTLPALADRTPDRRPQLAVVVGCTIVGIVLLLVAPVTLAIPAMALFGMGVGGGSTLGLVLITDVTHTQTDGARLGAMVVLVAYLAGALGPFALGVLRDLTGGFEAGYALMLALSVVTFASLRAYGPGREL